MVGEGNVIGLRVCIFCLWDKFVILLIRDGVFVGLEGRMVCFWV